MMTDELDERDSNGSLTAWAFACDSLVGNGCDCGDDEPGTCLACRCEAAMRAERARAERAEAEVERLRSHPPCKWETDHQREALERHGLLDMDNGCDSIDRVCEALVASRAERKRLETLVSDMADKTLRFDLDQVGITQREAEAIELVNLRAKATRMLDDIRAERNLAIAECNRLGELTYAARGEAASLRHELSDTLAELDGITAIATCAQREVKQLHSRVTEIADEALGLQVPGTPVLEMLDAINHDLHQWRIKAVNAEADLRQLQRKQPSMFKQLYGDGRKE